MCRIPSIAALMCLSACATVVNGTSDVVSVSSSPPGATFSVARGGAPLATVASTPGTVLVGKSGNSLDVTCTKPGYQSASTIAPSSFNGWTFGNLVVGGLIGVAVDLSTGANFDYPATVDVTLAPQPGAVPPLATTEKPSASLVATRMMSLADGNPAKRTFLLGACSAGDLTACILTNTIPPARQRAAERF